MRRAIFAIVAGLTFAFVAAPQETRETPAKQENEQHEPGMGWQWANFLLLAAGLGYLISKHAPAYFNQRSHEIQQFLVDAAKAKKDAEARAANIEMRLANLGREIEQLRNDAHAETAAESERFRVETERLLERIRQQAGQEVELMIHGARAGLKKYAAALALDLAEQRIHSRMTKDVQEELVDGFVRDLRARVKPGVMARN